MRLRRRPIPGQPDTTASSGANSLFGALTGPKGPLRYLFPGSGVPDELEPAVDPEKTRVFDDEVDPSWRQPPGTDAAS